MTGNVQGTVLQKVIKTIFLVVVWGCIGLCLEITGPTLIDLKLRTHSDYESVSTAVSGRSVGFFIGSVVGGLLVDKLGRYSNLMVAVCLDGMASFTAALPWSPVTELMFVIRVCAGACEGVINIAGQKLIIDMWLEKSASPLHILHGGFGIGSFIIPLVANPFLAKTVERTDTNTSVNGSVTSSTVETEATTTLIIERESRIEYAYAIAALVVIIVSVVFYIYHILDWRAGKLKNQASDTQKQEAVTEVDTKDEQEDQVLSFKEMVNPATCAGGRFVYGITLLLLVFLYFTQLVGGERIGGLFIRAFSIDYHGFTNDDGSYINTAFWIAFSCGRIGGFLTARWIPIRILIILETGGYLLSTIALAIFGSSGPTAIWIIMPLMGFFVAPLFPTGIGWANHHLEVTGVAITIFLLGASTGALAYTKLIGFLYDTYGPKMFIYTLLCQGIATFMMAVLMNIAGSKHGNTFEWVNNKEETDKEMEQVKK